MLWLSFVACLRFTENGLMFASTIIQNAEKCYGLYQKTTIFLPSLIYLPHFDAFWIWSKQGMINHCRNIFPSEWSLSDTILSPAQGISSCFCFGLFHYQELGSSSRLVWHCCFLLPCCPASLLECVRLLLLTYEDWYLPTVEVVLSYHYWLAITLIYVHRWMEKLYFGWYGSLDA